MTAPIDHELHLGRWPRCLNRNAAAQYCGMGITTFTQNVDKGALPKPFQMPTGILLWDRIELDAAIDILKTGRVSAEPRVINVREELKHHFRGPRKRRLLP